MNDNIKNNNNNNNNIQTTILCPCQSDFVTQDQILSALQDTSKTKSLISWLRNDDNNDSDNRKCYRLNQYNHSNNNNYNDNDNNGIIRNEEKEGEEGKGGTKNNIKRKRRSGNCPHRVTAAYHILNCIRDGCRDILEQSTNINNTTIVSSQNNNNNDNNIISSSLVAAKNKNKKSLSVSSAASTSIASSMTMSNQVSFSKSNNHNNKNNNHLDHNTNNYESAFPTLSSSLINSKSVSNPNILKTKKKKKTPPQQQSQQSQQQQQPNKQQSQQTSTLTTSTASNTRTKRRIRPLLSSSQTTISSSTSSSLDKTGNSNNHTHDTSSKTLPTISSSSSSPWNRIETTTSLLSSSSSSSSTTSFNQNGKQDPMDRIMNTKHIVTTRQHKDDNSINDHNDKKKKEMNENILITKKKQNNNNVISSENDNSMQSITSLSTSLANNVILETTSTTTNTKTNHDNQPNDSILYKNIIQVYITIIQCQLIPSIILELQLILRLLCLENDNDTQYQSISSHTTSNTIESKIYDLFSTTYKCQEFAISIFVELKPFIANLSHYDFLIIPLLRLNSIQCLLPRDMIQYLHECVESKMIGNAIGKGSNPTGGTNVNEMTGSSNNANDSGVMIGSMKSMILNVTFDEKRDSRHHFKSKDLGALYNNREQCRGMSLKRFFFMFANMSQ